MADISGFGSGPLLGGTYAGEPLSARTVNKYAGMIHGNVTGASNDLTFQNSSGGVTYGINQGVYTVSTGDYLDPNLNGDKVTVTPGTVNRYIPKIGTVYIDADPAPELTVTDEGYILIKVTYEANKFFPRTAEIVFQSGTSVPADSETESYWALAKVNKDTSTPPKYSLLKLGVGNKVVNRLKAGSNTATWWWTDL